MQSADAQAWTRIGLFIVLALTVPASAHAQDEERDELNRSPHTAETSIIVGAKAAQLNTFRDETSVGQSVEHGAGGGLFIETTLVEGWLELEAGLSLYVLPEPGELELPVDLLLKKPFCFGDIVQAYVALGPTLAIVFEGGETAVQVGGALVLGTYLWFTTDVGLDIEVDYALVAQDGELVQELTFGLGAVLRI